MAVAGDSEDDDPDPLVSRTDIFRVCVLASAILHEGTSAFYIYLGNQAGNTNTVEDILVEISGAGSWLAWVSTWSPGGLWTPFLVCAQATISSSFQDSSASSKYLGNQAGNIFTVEDLLMGAEWWWNTAWLEDYIEHGLFLSDDDPDPSDTRIVIFRVCSGQQNSISRYLSFLHIPGQPGGQHQIGGGYLGEDEWSWFIAYVDVYMEPGRTADSLPSLYSCCLKFLSRFLSFIYIPG